MTKKKQLYSLSKKICTRYQDLSLKKLNATKRTEKTNHSNVKKEFMRQNTTDAADVNLPNDQDGIWYCYATIPRIINN